MPEPLAISVGLFLEHRSISTSCNEKNPEIQPEMPRVESVCNDEGLLARILKVNSRRG